MRVAIVYDRINKIGGAEQVLVAFRQLFPQADWYTSVWDPKRAKFSANWDIHTSFLSHIPYLKNHHELFPFLMPFIFEYFNFSHYDLVISIGSAESKGIITRPGTSHINYCLTPTRYLYSHQDFYLQSHLHRFVAHYLRLWDQVASTRPDKMISISECVKNRVKKYYNRDSSVIYPPVDISRFSVQSNSYKLKANNYFLIVSRLVPYKNIQLAVRAFNANGCRLLIVGVGSDARRLKKLAASNIEFLGAVDDDQLPALYQGAKATLQCNEEDFGISMVESLASGTPVIAYSRGGASEIVTKDTGVLYNELSVHNLQQALDSFERTKFDPSDCRKQASKFDRTNWFRIMKERIDKYVGN